MQELTCLVIVSNAQGYLKMAFLRHASVAPETTLKLALFLKARGIRVAVGGLDTKSVLLMLDIVFRAQITEGLFGLKPGSLSNRIKRPTDVALVKQAWAKYGGFRSGGLIDAGLKAPCRSKGMYAISASEFNRMKREFRLAEYYGDWWDQNTIHMVSSIQSMLRRFLKRLTNARGPLKFGVDELIIDAFYPPKGSARKSLGWAMGNSQRNLVLNCKKTNRNTIDALTYYLNGLLTPSSLRGLGNKYLRSRAKESLALASQRYIEQGTPLGGGTPTSQFVDVFDQVRDDETGEIITAPEGVSIEDVMDNKDWANVLYEIFNNPNANKDFIQRLKDFVAESGVASGRARLPRAQNVISKYFEYLGEGLTGEQARVRIVQEMGIDRKTVQSYVQQTLLNLAKALDDNIDIPVYKGRGDTRVRVMPAESTSETRALAEALNDTFWMEKFRKSMERGRGLGDYIPEGARKQMRTRMPSTFRVPAPAEVGTMTKRERKRYQRSLERRDRQRGQSWTPPGIPADWEGLASKVASRYLRRGQ